MTTASREPKGLHKLGGVAFIASGLLFLLRDILDFVAGPPPSSGAGVLAWAASEARLLAIANETLFFAAMFMVPAVVALHSSLASIDRTKAATGCGLMVAAVPVLLVLVIVHGRLVYPVYGIGIDTPDVAALIVAVFYGGLHAVDILLGVAAFVLSLAMRRGIYGRQIAYLGIAASMGSLIGSYPSAIGPVPTLLCGALFAAWFVAVGSVLYGKSTKGA